MGIRDLHQQLTNQLHRDIRTDPSSFGNVVIINQLITTEKNMHCVKGNFYFFIF